MAETLQIGSDYSNQTSHLHPIKPQSIISRHKASQYDQAAFRRFLDVLQKSGLNCADSDPIFSDSDSDDDGPKDGDNEISHPSAQKPERETRQDLCQPCSKCK